MVLKIAYVRLHRESFRPVRAIAVETETHDVSVRALHSTRPLVSLAQGVPPVVPDFRIRRLRAPRRDAPMRHVPEEFSVAVLFFLSPPPPLFFETTETLEKDEGSAPSRHGIMHVSRIVKEVRVRQHGRHVVTRDVVRIYYHHHRNDS